MGHSYQFECENCKSTQQLYEGWAFMVHDQSVSDYLKSGRVKLHYKTHKKILDLNKQHNNLHLKMEYRIHRCHQCLQVSDRLNVEVLHGEKILHKTRFKCAACKITLTHTNIHSLKYAICPKCKSKKFKKSKELVLWN